MRFGLTVSIFRPFSYLLIDAIILTKHKISSHQTCYEWMNICFFIAVQLLLQKHCQLVNGGEYTQVPCMLLGCSKHKT